MGRTQTTFVHTILKQIDVDNETLRVEVPQLLTGNYLLLSPENFCLRLSSNTLKELENLKSLKKGIKRKDVYTKSQILDAVSKAYHRTTNEELTTKLKRT